MEAGHLYKVANIIGFARGKPSRISLEVIYPTHNNPGFSMFVTKSRLDLKKLEKCSDPDICKFHILYGK